MNKENTAAVSEKDSPIDAIVAIDRAAREKVEAARLHAEKILADAAAKKKSLGDDNAARLSEATEGRFASARQKTDDAMRGFEKAADDKCRLLDEKMSADRENWKKEIIERILG